MKNVSKIFREYEGYASFKEWFNTENNIYIGRNAAKYTSRNVPDSKWANPYLIFHWKGSNEEWILEDFMKLCKNRPPFNPKSLMGLKLHGASGGGQLAPPSKTHFRVSNPNYFLIQSMIYI